MAGIPASSRLVRAVTKSSGSGGWLATRYCSSVCMQRLHAGVAGIQASRACFGDLPNHDAVTRLGGHPTRGVCGVHHGGRGTEESKASSTISREMITMRVPAALAAAGPSRSYTSRTQILRRRRPLSSDSETNLDRVATLSEGRAAALTTTLEGSPGSLIALPSLFPIDLCVICPALAGLKGGTTLGRGTYFCVRSTPAENFSRSVFFLS